MSESRVPEGFGVSKLSVRPDDPAVIDLRFLSAADVNRGETGLLSGTLTGLAGGGLAGRHRLEWAGGEGGPPIPVELDIVPHGTVFDLVARGPDGQLLTGMGIADPQSPDGLLVSWSSDQSSVRPVGIVKYMIDPAQTDRIDAVYTSIAAQAGGHYDVLGGRATGDTTGGFPGHYSITYEGVNGTSHGPFDWVLERKGDVYRLTWDQGGFRAIEGFGFQDPQTEQALVVNYWTPHAGT